MLYNYIYLKKKEICMYFECMYFISWQDFLKKVIHVLVQVILLLDLTVLCLRKFDVKG